jgi:hypothetical protein
MVLMVARGEKGQALFVAKPEPRAASWGSHARWESPREGWESPLIALAPSSRRNEQEDLAPGERTVTKVQRCDPECRPRLLVARGLSLPGCNLYRPSFLCTRGVQEGQMLYSVSLMLRLAWIFAHEKGSWRARWYLPLTRGRYFSAAFHEAHVALNLPSKPRRPRNRLPPVHHKL